jgi:hypothetical protein
MMHVLGEATAKKSYKEVLVGLEKSTTNTTKCRIQSAVPIAIVSKVQCANSQGGLEEVNPSFFAEGHCQTTYATNGVSGSKGAKEVSCDLCDLRVQLECLRGEMDRLIECLDMDLGLSGSENKVSPVGVIVVGLKPNPKGKVLSSALEPNSMLMGQTKGVIVRGKGPLVSQARRPIRPKVKPRLSGG